MSDHIRAYKTFFTSPPPYLFLILSVSHKLCPFSFCGGLLCLYCTSKITCRLYSSCGVLFCVYCTTLLKGRENNKNLPTENWDPGGYALAAGYESHPGKECAYPTSQKMEGTAVVWEGGECSSRGRGKQSTEWAQGMARKYSSGFSKRNSVKIILVTGLICRKINCNMQRNSAAFVLAACARKRSKLQ